MNGRRLFSASRLRLWWLSGGLLLTGATARAQALLWTLEAESPESRVVWHTDTAEIFAPQGLTLWYKEKMAGNVIIRYDACVVNHGQEGERTSDLNCFWMASDPKAADVWERMAERQGVFTRCYALQLYYMGFGGNSNTTTRFRRYTGDERGIEEPAYRPDILIEHRGQEQRLAPNRWYRIQLEAVDGRVRYLIDGQCLADWQDEQPLTEGWFGFRTTWSHTLLTNFQYLQKP